MLGAAPYVASLRPPEDGQSARHLPGELDALVSGLERDCLSPVASRMALPDLLSNFMPLRRSNDRGRVLEDTWEQNIGRDCPAAGKPMAGPFRDLAVGEREGWRPSMIVSPMIVEVSAPMLISNLDLGDLNRDEFFKKFADEPAVDADQLKLSSAVRMNANFPLVTPDVCLPTEPPLRLVDAGYYDNYGVNTAIAWLTSNLDWLTDNTGGVILIQVRAYPASVPAVQSSGLWYQFAESIKWLTTPLEAYTAARQRVMIDRNNDLVVGLRRAFLARLPGFPFETAELECPESAPLSWYLTQKDRKKLERVARTDEISQAHHEVENSDDRLKYRRELNKVVRFLAGDGT